MAAQETLLNGRYRLDKQHASGGMAVVYAATDLALNRKVAIKILRPSLTGDPTFLTRFREEARNVANLNHPNIVTLYDVGQDGNTYYMVMEFIDGQDLKKLIRSEAPFSVERALHIAIQICAGIGYAHRSTPPLVHADVKPQNILITGNTANHRSDIVKVTDFGIAQVLSQTQPQTKQSVVWGSPHYFAPEQASGDTPTPASDVYSIGIVMFEMLTGKLPFTGADQQELAMAHLKEQIPHVMEVNPQVPVQLDRIIYKVMDKVPTGRYKMADQLGRILISYQKQGQDNTSNQPPAAGPVPVVQSPVVKPQPIQPNQPVQAPQPINPFGTPQRPNQYGVPAQQPQPQPQQHQPPATQQPVYGPPTVNPAPTVQPNAQQPYNQGQAGANHGRPGTGPVAPANAARSADPYAYNNRQQPAAPNQYNQYGAAPVQQPNQPNYDQYGRARPGTGQMPPSMGNTGGTGNLGGSRPSPRYDLPPQPNSIDLVSIILAGIAFLLVLGLFPLWLAVLGAWFK